MSLIGKKTIPLPKGVEVNVAGDVVNVKGPKGAISQKIVHNVKVTVAAGAVNVTCDDSNENKKFHGLYRALINNHVKGVSEGFKKTLQINGVGFKFQVAGPKLTLNIGYCHPVELAVPKGVSLVQPDPTTLEISGVDKQLVGEFASKIRSLKPPEPYKGKGIKYSDEVIKRKAGKATV
ncbi:MAG: 50S ribosomal protein L6 [Planctomycetota bacterium]